MAYSHDALCRSYSLEIRIAGTHADRWSSCFGGVALRPAPDGDTILAGVAADPAALFGILRTLETLGTSVISIVARPVARDRD